MPQPWRPVAKDQPAKPGASKQKRRRRYLAQNEIAPLTLADVPVGSVLSDATIAAIQAGELVRIRSKGARPLGPRARRLQREADRARNLLRRE